LRFSIRQKIRRVAGEMPLFWALRHIKSTENGGVKESTFLRPMKESLLNRKDLNVALLQIDHVSEKVGVNLPLNVILPDDLARGGKALEERKVLYLLHGLSDDASAWPRYTNIEILAREHGLVVVMPSAGRSFYADMANGQAYFSYITEELPAWLAAIFRISSARENTYIAGLSMGGYGAFKAAFLRPDLYTAACSLSGVLALNAFLAPPDKIENQALMHEFDLLSADCRTFRAA